MSKRVLPLTILVIDDEPLIRWALLESLGEVGHSVNLGLLAAIRTSLPESAVVLMSASATPEMVSAAYELGAYRVISKPFDLVELHTLVTSVSAASRESGGDCHDPDRHDRVPVSVSMDRTRYGDAFGEMALRDLHAQL